LRSKQAETLGPLARRIAPSHHCQTASQRVFWSWGTVAEDLKCRHLQPQRPFSRRHTTASTLHTLPTIAQQQPRIHCCPQRQSWTTSRRCRVRLVLSLTTTITSLPPTRATV
jgi:hypothetical protein